MHAHERTSWLGAHGRAAKGAIAALVATVMIAAFAIGAARPAAAAEATLTADPTTYTQWTEGLDGTIDPGSTGRVWADKSVGSGDVTLTTHDGRDVTVAGEPDALLVGLSAMSSAQEVTGVTGGAHPLDVTLVLDVSGSMASAMSTTYEPAYGDFHKYDMYVEDPERTDEYARIYYRGDDYYYYDHAGDKVHVTPKTAADDAEAGRAQFYKGEHVTRLDALKQSVGGFLDLMAQRNAGVSNEALKNRAAVISYSTDAQIDAAFTSDAAQLASVVDGLSERGSTYAGRGLEVAQELIGEHKRADADGVVIFFTDGEAFDMNLAMQKANELKSAGTAIYSVGVFKGADANDMDRDANKFMQGISGNYPKAVITGDGQWLLGERAEGDHYLTASDSDQLDAIFKDIWTAISSKPTSPLASAATERGAERGTVTFTDTLGDYMTVRDVKSVLFAGTLFDRKTTATEDGVTTVTFEGDVEGNPIHGPASLADLRIEIARGQGAAGDVVTVSVPEQLLPLRLYSASVDRDGAVTTDIRRTHPIRVFYTVGLKDGVADRLDDPDEVLAAYMQANAADGGRRFPANAGLGSTTAVFTPAKSNAFYYFTEDTPLYASKNTADPATSIAADGTYYYPRTYYADNAAHERWTAVSGASVQGKVARDAAGEWYAQAGAPRLGLANYTVAKVANPTGTAAAAHAPSWDGVLATVALGNSGHIAFPTGQSQPAGEAGATTEPSQEPTVPGTVDVPKQADPAAAPAATATTGSSVAIVVAVAVVLVVAGVTLLVLARRRS